MNVGSGVTIKHLRKMVELAYYDVEELREAKAKAENVPYVPGEKPVNISYYTIAVNHLEKLAQQKASLETWFKNAEVELEYQEGQDLLKLLQPFGVSYVVHNGSTYGGSNNVQIVKQARVIHRTERETYGD